MSDIAKKTGWYKLIRHVSTSVRDIKNMVVLTRDSSFILVRIRMLTFKSRVNIDRWVTSQTSVHEGQNCGDIYSLLIFQHLSISPRFCFSAQGGWSVNSPRSDRHFFCKISFYGISALFLRRINWLHLHEINKCSCFKQKLTRVIAFWYQLERNANITKRILFDAMGYKIFFFVIL